MAYYRMSIPTTCLYKNNLRLITAFFVGMLILLLGCSTPSNSLPAKWNISFGQPPSEDISTRVLLIADNQLHNLYADPVPIMRSGLADKVVEVAIRPVQLDLYGSEALALVVKNDVVRQSVIHLGDACDFSCKGEFIKFLSIMRHANQGWIMIPGNHDGYFWGNEQRASDDPLWTAACKNSEAPLSKDLYIRFYLVALMAQNREGCQGLARRLGIGDDLFADGDAKSLSYEKFTQLLENVAPELPQTFEWQNTTARGQPGTVLQRIAWEIDPVKPWRSFILQEVDISRHFSNGTVEKPYVRLLLFDTSQYSTAPSLVPLPFIGVNAGVSGEIGKNQLRIARQWIEDRTEPGNIRAFIGHHPYKAFRKSTMDEFGQLRRNADAYLYVSAHTHKGEFVVHGPDAAKPGADPRGPDNWLEMNIGSITDWPQVYRTLRFYKYNERVGFESIRYTLLDKLFVKYGAEDQRLEWEAKPQDEDYFLHHRYLHTLAAAKTEDKLRTAMLASYMRMLGVVKTQVERRPEPGNYWPDDLDSDDKVIAWIKNVKKNGTLKEKTEALLKLDRFERERPKDDFLSRQYRLNQALWASKYDASGAHSPALYDRYIIFP